MKTEPGTKDRHRSLRGPKKHFQLVHVWGNGEKPGEWRGRMQNYGSTAARGRDLLRGITYLLRTPKEHTAGG